MKTAYTVGKGYAKEVVEPKESEAMEDDAEAEEGDAEEGDAEANEGEKDGQQDEKERADGLADQSDQAKVREIDETIGADIGLTRQNDAETAVIQDELSKILAENQMVLDEFGVNQAESAGTAPASLEKSTADMTALQQPAGDQAQTQAAANREEKTELNQPPVWRPARMDFRKK